MCWRRRQYQKQDSMACAIHAQHSHAKQEMLLVLKKIFIPGVIENRAEFNEDEMGVEAQQLTEIPVQDTAVVSIDGDIPQLKAVIADMDMYEEHRIIFNKLNAAASAVDRARSRLLPCL